MKIIGYAASQRENGSTKWAVSQILGGAKEKGAETRLFHSKDIEIKPCQGCGGCKVENGKCVINDDMQPIYTALKAADALVIGSPVYMGQMTGQAKTFIDRLYAQVSPRFSPHFKEENAGKKLILVFTQGNPDADKFKAYIDYTKDMFTLLEFDVKDVVVVTDTRSCHASEKAGLADTMKSIGAKLQS